MEKLIELIKKGGFRIKSYDNWKMYLEEMSEMLISQGDAIEGFKEAMISREENFPTGLETMSLPVSIPHADKKYVKTEMIDVTLFEKPVMFHRIDSPEEEIGSYISFMLLLKESHAHMDVLRELSQLFQLEKFADIIHVKSQEELISFLKEVA